MFFDLSLQLDREEAFIQEEFARGAQQRDSVKIISKAEMGRGRVMGSPSYLGLGFLVSSALRSGDYRNDRLMLS